MFGDARMPGVFFGIEIRSSFMTATVMVGRRERLENSMADWDEIATRKEAERQRIANDRKQAERTRSEHEALIAKFMTQLGDLVKARVDERNVLIPLPGNRITFSPMGAQGVQITHKAAILRTTLTETDGKRMLDVTASGLEPDGSHTSTTMLYILTPAGGEIAITQGPGFRTHDAVLIGHLADSIFSAFAEYAA